MVQGSVPDACHMVSMHNDHIQCRCCRRGHWQNMTYDTFFLGLLSSLHGWLNVKLGGWQGIRLGAGRVSGSMAGRLSDWVAGRVSG